MEIFNFFIYVQSVRLMIFTASKEACFVYVLENVWNVTVYTSDIRGAGTDANVSFVLYGNKGKTEVIPLANETNNFERGNADQFKVDIKDVGVPYKIRIGHDNSKLYSDWHLEKVKYFMHSLFISMPCFSIQLCLYIALYQS